jgi:phosphate-selective porin OprO/OprP
MSLYKNRTTALILLSLVFFGFKSNLNAQSHVTGKFGKGISFLAQDSSYSVKMGFRFQTLYTGTYNETSEAWSEDLIIRRSRLKFDGYVFDPSVVYKLELGLSNRDTQSGSVSESGNTSNIILDAALKWTFAKNWTLWVGQTKLPGNRERVISSQNLQFVDRSQLNSRFNLDRDIGIQLHHKFNVGKVVIKDIYAISTGEGRNVIVKNPKNGKEYTARVEILPFGNFTNKGDYFGSDLAREKDPKLSIGITGDYNHNAGRTRGNLGSFKYVGSDPLVSSLKTLFVDAMFKWNGVSVESEYVNRNSSDKVASFGYGTAFTASLGYLFKNNIELAGRYTTLSPISTYSSIAEASEYAVGFSKYIVGHSLKFQSDVSYTDQKVGANFYRIRFQFELAL